MAAQTSFGQISESEFSHLLKALSATTKGRAFLNEYRRRLRPQETGSLLDALGRIETTIGSVRDQLQPERIADELRRIAMTLEIAADGAAADPEGDDTARRMALVNHACAEIATLAAGLASDPPPVIIHLGRRPDDEPMPNLGGSAQSRRALLRQAAEDDSCSTPSR
jgi:hypothetical protein